MIPLQSLPSNVLDTAMFTSCCDPLHYWHITTCVGKLPLSAVAVICSQQKNVDTRLQECAGRTPGTNTGSCSFKSVKVFLTSVVICIVRSMLDIKHNIDI